MTTQITLSALLENELRARGLRSSISTVKGELIKTTWEYEFHWREGLTGHGSHWVWVCDVYDDNVAVWRKDVPSQDYVRHEWSTFYATDPNFLEKVFQAIDKAMRRK